MSRRSLLVFALALSLALPLSATSTLKLTQDKKTISLPQVSAVRFVPNEGPAETFLLFSDVKQDGLTLVGPFGEEMLSIPQWMEGKTAHVVKVSFKEGNEENYSLNFYGDGKMLSEGGYHSGDGMRGIFKKVNVTEKQIAGEIKATAQENSLAGSFDVQPQVVHQATSVSGPAVAKSAEATAVLGFVRAMNKLDLKAAQAFSARNLEEEFGKAKEAMGEKAVKEMVHEMIGDPVKIAKQLQSKDAVLLEAGDRAQVRLTETMQNESGHGSSTNTFSLRKVAGQWKIE